MSDTHHAAAGGRGFSPGGRGSRVSISFLLGALLACSAAPPQPATLDTRHETCGSCRMVVSDQKFAAQIVARGEGPMFFDDLGCLARRLGKAPLPEGAAIFVADHRTAEWVSAGAAVFTRVPLLDTPMGSHIIAHATEASRDADPAAQGGEHLNRSDVSPGLSKGASR